MEPDIAPLAKRLAEENNVNWQHLQGSGANGRIVERDVLEYLARVMSGEEDLNPTAEPIPDGMQAWPEQDVKAFFGEQKSSSSPTLVQDFEADEDLLDVSDDLYDTKSFSDEELDFSSDLPDTNALNDDKLDEDVFLFDDDVLGGDYSETAATDMIVEADSFEEVDMLLDDSAFDLETAKVDAFASDDPFAEADTGFAFENSFAEVAKEAESSDFDTDAFLLEDDQETLDLSPDLELTSDLLDEDLSELPSSQQAAHEAADELFAVDLDEDLGFDEDVASLFVDAEDESPAAFEAVTLDLDSEDLLGADSDDFAVDALNDLLPEDVLVEDLSQDSTDQDSAIAFSEEAIEATETDNLSEDLLQDTDDLFVDSDAEALLDNSDELFDFEDESDELLSVDAETQTNESLFDFSETASEEDADTQEALSLAEEQDVEASTPSFANIEMLEDESDEIDLDFEANANEVLGLSETDSDAIQLEESLPEPQDVLDAQEEPDTVQLEAVDEVFEEDLLNEEVEAQTEVPEVAVVAQTISEARVEAPITEDLSAQESMPETPMVVPVTAPVQSSPFMSFGLLLRRHVEASALQDIREIAREELQQDDIDLTVFLIRAAAKAVGENIAYAKILDNQIEVKQVKPSFNVSFRETLAALDKASAVQDIHQLTLIVANMSNLDIDEAVLNLPVPVLTLGRLHDGKMTLTLSGNIPADKGSSLLSEMANLLAHPVRLLV